MNINERDREILRALFPKISYMKAQNVGSQQIYRILQACFDHIQTLESEAIKQKLGKNFCQLHAFKEEYGVAFIANANKFTIFNPHDASNFAKTQQLGSIACRCGHHFDGNPFERIKKDYAMLFKSNWYKGYLQQWRAEITLVTVFDKEKIEARLAGNTHGDVCYRCIVNDQHKYYRVHPDSFSAFDWDTECWFEYWGPEEENLEPVKGVNVSIK